MQRYGRIQFAEHSPFYYDFTKLPGIVFCRLSDPSQYQSIVDAEWNIIYEKLDKCVESGAKVVLSRLAIGDLGTQVVTFVFSHNDCISSILGSQ